MRKLFGPSRKEIPSQRAKSRISPREIQIPHLVWLAEVFVREVVHEDDGLAGGFHLRTKLLVDLWELVPRENGLFDRVTCQG